MKQLVHWLPVLLLCHLHTAAQVSTRLSDHWEFLRQDLGSPWEAVRPVEKGSPESVPIWKPVSLPHCSSEGTEVDPDQNYYQGPAWYRTEIFIENQYRNGRTLLHFEGAGQETEVYVHTTKVGSHVGGYDEFTIDITEAVAEFSRSNPFREQFKGKIPISIRTDNSRNVKRIPSSMSDFMVYGGIYRHLNLVYTPAVSVEKLLITPVLNGKKGSVEIKARLYAREEIANLRYEISIMDPKGQTVSSENKEISNTNNSIAFLPVSIHQPEPWHPDDPKLYSVQLKIISGESMHTTEETFGFREAEFLQKGPFLLNGERLLLRGTHRHEDFAGVGAALTDEMIRKEMILMKEMGVNFVRLGHYQQSRLVLDLCDSLGILVWEEIPWCRGGLGGAAYQQQAKNMLTNMIEQHYNHPSIIIWGLGNENDWPGDFPEFNENEIRAFMRELNDLSHTLDPMRKTAIRRCDFCKDIVDVYSPSIWAGWYRGVYTDYKKTSEKEKERVNHFLHVEWGGDSHAGRHSENPDNDLAHIRSGNGNDERTGDASFYGGNARVSKDGDWSESYIVNLFDWHLKEQETMPWLTGSAQWVFKDFATPLRPENPVPYVNQKGVLERDLTKKESYFVFQSYWSKEPMVHIYGHSWPVRWGEPGEMKTIKAYSNCEEAELFFNGRSMGVKKRNPADFPAAGLRWMVPPIPGTNQVKVVARKGKQSLTDSLEFEYQTGKWGKPAKLAMEKAAEKNDTVSVLVKLLDENGLICLDAANYVRFTLAGDGSLIESEGTSSGSSYLQMYNGRAIIYIKKNKGKNTIAAKIDGLETSFLSF